MAVEWEERARGIIAAAGLLPRGGGSARRATEREKATAGSIKTTGAHRFVA